MRRLLTLFVLLLSFAAGSAFAQQFSSLEERMTEAEFKAAGLDKLSAEELAALNAWIAGRAATAPAGSGGVAAAPSEDRRGFLDSPDEDALGDIVSTINGRFRGWDGRGVRITLANGQIWETAEGGKFSVNAENPTVIISPGMLNSWSLRIDGYNARVRVKRIK